MESFNTLNDSFCSNNLSEQEVEHLAVPLGREPKQCLKGNWKQTTRHSFVCKYEKQMKSFLLPIEKALLKATRTFSNLVIFVPNN